MGKDSKKIAAGALIGAAAGVIAGVLFAGLTVTIIGRGLTAVG